MKMICLLTTLVFLSCHVKGQEVLPQKIRISEGHCTSACGFGEGFHYMEYEKQFEYRLTDRSLWYRRDISTDFNHADVAAPFLFDSPHFYKTLDSLYEVFPGVELSLGKYSFYKIELIYCTAKMGMPVKTKTMEFFITTAPQKRNPPVLDLIAACHEDMMRKRKFK